MTDGVRGTTSPGKFWHAFDGNDLTATIDFGQSISIHQMSIGCLQSYNDWIFLPQSVTYEISDDGTNFTTAGTVNNTISPNEKSALIKDFT